MIIKKKMKIKKSLKILFFEQKSCKNLKMDYKFEIYLIILLFYMKFDNI